LAEKKTKWKVLDEDDDAESEIDADGNIKIKDFDKE